MALDPVSTNFILKYATEIVLGLVVVLLSALKLLGQRTQAEAMKSSIATTAVTQVEMLEYQMQTITLIREEFDKFRLEIRGELSAIHRRVDEIKVSVSQK